MRRNTIIYTVLILLFIILYGCSSDPEAPVIGRFKDSTYVPDAGETFFYSEILQHSIVHLSTNVGGHCSFLKLGWNKGLKFETLLLDFDFDSLVNYIGKTVSKVTLKFPVRMYPGNFDLKIGLYELNGPFSEDDSLLSGTAPTWADTQIPDSLGFVSERILRAGSLEFSIASDIVQNAIDGTGDLWENGIAVHLEEEPDSMGFYEINSADTLADLEGGPIALIVEFEDDTTNAFFGVKRDYSLVSYDNDDLALLGGVATRIYFEFNLEGISDSATVNNAELVLNVDGSGGLGASAGEQELLGATLDFYYYLYSPDVADALDPSFREGTGVDEGVFYPEVTGELRFPLKRYTEDILDGSRINYGLVLQSDLEETRFQKALFYSGDVDSLMPRIEIIYSMPADFDGEK
ncbi:hypothetical protein J7M07_04475 [bacterium]|nr:hypothetical protein [bacterium]